MKDFFTLSMHQRLNFIHNVYLRIRPNLPRKREGFLGRGNGEADYNELIGESDFYRSLRFTMLEYNQQKMQTIYRRLNPGDKLQLPPKLRCRSIIIMIFADFFNLFQTRLREDSLLKVIETALLKLGTINEAEAGRLETVYEFSPETRTINFAFQEKRYRCQLNPNSILGFELTLLPDANLDSEEE